MRRISTRIDGIERMLRVNERRLPAEFLRLGDDVQCHRGLAARFRPVNLNHAPAWKAADPQRRVNREASAGDHTNGYQNIPAAQAHDCALAMVLFNLRYRRCQQSFSVVCHFTPRWRKLENLACGADGRGSAPGTRVALVQGRNEVWSLPLDSSSRHPFLLLHHTRPCHPEAIRQGWLQDLNRKWCRPRTA